MNSPIDDQTEITIEPLGLKGLLGIPPQPHGLVIFAHGSGSGRLSPRNNHVARALRKAGLATLLTDLLTPAEELDRDNVFNIPLLGDRLWAATEWARRDERTLNLLIGYFGASTGAGAALVAAARPDAEIAAIVSRGGRPDLAGERLKQVRAPTLLIVGGADYQVLELNAHAFEELTREKDLIVIPGAGHLFEEPGTLDEVVREATNWFRRYLDYPAVPPLAQGDVTFRDRVDAGKQLAARLMRYKASQPIVLALPRGGVPVGCEIAKTLAAPLDVVLVRKIGAPGHPELGLGAVVDGKDPQVVLNDEVVAMVAPPAGHIDRVVRKELDEIERRKHLYRRNSEPPERTGRTLILVDDGIATGGTVRAVLRALRRERPARLVLAVPVAPERSLESLAGEADEIVCLATPEPFYAVGVHYIDFNQVTDQEVSRLLAEADAAAHA